MVGGVFLQGKQPLESRRDGNKETKRKTGTMRRRCLEKESSMCVSSSHNHNHMDTKTILISDSSPSLSPSLPSAPS
jgi:hypothetical protein